MSYRKLIKFFKKLIPQGLKKNAFLRKTIALIASLYFRFPGKKLLLIGVTGTTGKSTTTFMIKSILEEAGIKTGLIGTTGYYLGNEVIYNQTEGPGTTPDPFVLHRLLRKMVQQQIKVAIIEVSSFGLMYWRTYGLHFKVAVLTNIAYNHHVVLHGGMENYVQAKLQLFRYLNKNDIAVLPKDSEYFSLFKNNTPAQIITYGFNADSDVWISDNRVYCQNENFDLKLKIPGKINLLNALASIAATSSLKIPLAKIKAGLEKLESIPGRLEIISSQAPFTIIVDKANTPLAFEGLIDFLKSDYPKNRKIVVYGTFNESPLEERNMLAKLATDFFDLVIFTEDDPKDEPPQKPFEDFLNFVQTNHISPDKYLIISKRREAIKTAIEKAQPQDLILILGRGNEQLMYYKNKIVPFDDREVTKQILKEFSYL